MRGLACLLMLAATSCSEPAPTAAREEAPPTAQSTATATAAKFVATNTSEELAFLATHVCRPQVTKEGAAADADLGNALTGRGYGMASSQVSRQLFGRVLPGFFAARKEDELGRVMVAYGECLPACVVLLTDDSVVPPVKEIREAFESQGWQWAHMAAKVPDRLPYAGFTTTDKNGKTVLAVLRDEPDSDPKVRLGIEISYTDF